MTEARQDAGWGTFDGYEASGLCVQKSWLWSLPAECKNLVSQIPMTVIRL